MYSSVSLFLVVNCLLELNERITKFLQESGTLYSTQQWLLKHKLPAWSARKERGAKSVIDNDTFTG
jgi:hypothetical protein